jgi:cadmium resistance protein CadD (predicted permease)
MKLYSELSKKEQKRRIIIGLLVCILLLISTFALFAMTGGFTLRTLFVPLMVGVLGIWKYLKIRQIVRRLPDKTKQEVLKELQDKKQSGIKLSVTERQLMELLKDYVNKHGDTPNASL